MIDLRLLTIAAITNGLNPCGIGLMITFLGYLLVFGKNGEKKNGVLKMGLVYILSVFVTYLLIGMVFYGAAYYLQRWWLVGYFKYLIGGAVLVAGLIQLKDVVWEDLPIHLKMPMLGFEKINKLMGKMSLPMAALVGFLTTVFSSPCMLPLYIGTATVLARSGLSMLAILGYFVYYNIIFTLPLSVVLLIMHKGKGVVSMKEWQHRNTKWLRLLLGMVMVAVAGLIMR